MQRCPKCGYQEMDWPAVLTILAVAVLYIKMAAVPAGDALRSRQEVL
jgi:hypothetical protein